MKLCNRVVKKYCSREGHFSTGLLRSWRDLRNKLSRQRVAHAKALRSECTESMFQDKETNEVGEDYYVGQGGVIKGTCRCHRECVEDRTVLTISGIFPKSHLCIPATLLGGKQWKVSSAIVFSWAESHLWIEFGPWLSINQHKSGLCIHGPSFGLFLAEQTSSLTESFSIIKPGFFNSPTRGCIADQGL